MKIIIGLFALGLVFTSCTKSEGLGGSAKIKGTVTIKDYNSLGTLISEYSAQDEKVFIIYGSEDNITDDDVSTSYDGTYEFNYLQKGTYTVYAYSDCISCPNGQDSAVSVTVEITEKGQEIDLSEIILRR